MSLLLLLLIFGGCRAPERTVFIEQHAYTYPGPLDISGKITRTLTNRDPAHLTARQSFQRHWALWEYEHQALVQALHQQRRLAVWEAHRRLVAHLQALQQHLPLPASQHLQDYIDLYANLLLQFERHTSVRILQRKYAILKDQLTEELLKTKLTVARRRQSDQ